MKSNIITSDHEEFGKWLAIPPPGWKNANCKHFAITPDSAVLTPISENQLNELLIDAKLFRDDSFDEPEDIEEDSEESILVYPDHIGEIDF